MDFRKLLVIFGVLSIGMIFTGCSMTRGNLGQGIMTEVQLNQANFDVIGSVTGEASAAYFFGIGPSKQDLFGQAKRDMIKKANLKGSKALVNVTTDWKDTWYFIGHQQKVYVSAEIVQFK
jgi:hypothetical protein